MLQAERMQIILNKAEEQNFVTVEEMSQLLNVSLMTIRRDLNTLCEQSLLERCHGGARIPEDTIMEIDYNIKKEYHQEEKQRIARKAMELIKDNDTVYLDSGTTIGELAKLLCEDSKHISVVTNELNIATILTDSDVDLTILGGTVHKKTKSVIGHVGEEFLKQFRFSKAFLGTSSVSYNLEVFSPTPDKAYLKKMVMDLASQVYLVVDSSKFYCQAMCLVGSLSQFAGVITDKKFSEKEWDLIRELNINVIEV